MDEFEIENKFDLFKIAVKYQIDLLLKCSNW